MAGHPEDYHPGIAHLIGDKKPKCREWIRFASDCWSNEVSQVFLAYQCQVVNGPNCYFLGTRS